MLWEIWGRRKVNFAFHTIALMVSLFCVRWIQHGTNQVVERVLVMVMLSCFLGAYFDLLTCFGYIEADARKIQLGYPARLLLKPVSTLRLVLVPMLVGGAIVATVLLIWNQYILQPLAHTSALNPYWLGAIVVSFFWWMQALAWSLPLMPGRSLIMLIVALIHLGVGILPLLPNSLSGWQWLILVVLLVSAVLTAWTGLGLMRQGKWDGPSRLNLFWNRWPSFHTTGMRGKFGSAFAGQFWLEWRRQGLILPGITSGIMFVILPLIFLVNQQSGVPAQGADFVKILLILTLLVPLVISSMMGATIARFDQLQASNALPVYIGARPITNGGLVIAKLAMALASSALTWLTVLVVAAFWLVVLQRHWLISLIPDVSPFHVVTTAIGCVPILLLLILYTWKNLVAGIGAGLTGRRWVVGIFTGWKAASAIALVGLFTAAKFNSDFQAALLHWLPELFFVALVAKVAVAFAIFSRGLRQNVITSGCVGWIACGWLAAGFFVTGYAGLVCRAMRHSDLWLPITLGGFLILPLPDLAIAPLALTWNRHR
jgi:hypothetical protein